MSTSSTTAAVRRRPQATIGLIVVIAAVIAALAALDTVLENAEELETQTSAQEAYQSGQKALGAGRTDAAIEYFRKAHAALREDETYELALVGALMAAGRVSDAAPLMNEALERTPNDGPALLLAARLNVKKGKPIQAAAFYHRAIYGEWPSEARTSQIAARFELVEFLKSRGQNDAMLAELIPLEEEAGKDKSLLLRTARLFLEAGAPGHAETAYRSVIATDPHNSEAYAGLGEVELESGDYHRARTEFLQAQTRDPGNAAIAKRLELAKALGDLDPTSRRLTSLEKYRRSLLILQLARDDFQSCASSRPGATTENGSDLLNEAGTLLPGNAPAQATNELAEHLLDVAQQLWQTRVKDCGPSAAPDGDLLRLIMEKVAK